MWVGIMSIIYQRVYKHHRLECVCDDSYEKIACRGTQTQVMQSSVNFNVTGCDNWTLNI